jgi:hypothetical protein
MTTGETSGWGGAYTRYIAFAPAHLAFEIVSRDRAALVARIRAANFDVEESAGMSYAIARDPFGNTIDVM